ncbi:MAG: MerR family transcriptional regulator [Microbacteriaceae bacterium]
MVAERAQALSTGLSIGQVLTQLRIQFPDLTSTKLRYLEEEDLITPTRLSSGYRSYSVNDINRIRMVLTLQRDHFLPLRVIHGILSEVDAGRKPVLPSGAELTVESMLSLEVRFTRSELLSKSGAPAALLNEAITAGLIIPSEIYGEDAMSILQALVELTKSGIEPRHMRGLKQQAEKDAQTLRNVVLPISKSSSRVGRQRAIDTARGLALNLEKVRIALMMRSVDESLD